MTAYPEIEAVLAGERDGCIVCGDAAEIVPEIPRDGVAVVTDPPYGVGFRSEGWDSEIPQVATELPGLFSPCAIITAPTTMWEYIRPDWVLCWTRSGATSRTTSGTFNHWTPILLYGAKGPNPDLLKLPGCGYAGQRPSHPCPKPVRLMAWLIEPMPPGGIILDPFCGSGTTCVAAKQLGRRWIGIEIDEKYAALARERVRNTTPPLFT